MHSRSPAHLVLRLGLQTAQEAQRLRLGHPQWLEPPLPPALALALNTGEKMTPEPSVMTGTDPVVKGPWLAFAKQTSRHRLRLN